MLGIRAISCLLLLLVIMALAESHHSIWKRHGLFKRAEDCEDEMRVAADCLSDVEEDAVKIIEMLMRGEEQAARSRYDELNNGEFIANCKKKIDEALVCCNDDSDTCVAFRAELQRGAEMVEGAMKKATGKSFEEFFENE